MNEAKKKPVTTDGVAVTSRAPYTAAREGKNEPMNGAEADRFGLALDRRLTEGLNLLHGRLDVIQEDVRENRRDIKELRKETWDGLRAADADRARLATKADLALLRDADAEGRGQLETKLTAAIRAVAESAAAGRQALAEGFRIQVNDLRTETNERLGALQESVRELAGTVNPLVERSTAAAQRLTSLEESVNGLAERSATADLRLASLDESQRELIGTVNALKEWSTTADQRLTVLEESQRKLIGAVSALAGTVNALKERSTTVEQRLTALEASQRQFRAEVNERLDALQESQGRLAETVGKALERSTAAVWTSRRIAVAVGAGTILLVVGAVMRPLLAQAVAALLAG